MTLDLTLANLIQMGTIFVATVAIVNSIRISQKLSQAAHISLSARLEKIEKKLDNGITEKLQTLVTGAAVRDIQLAEIKNHLDRCPLLNTERV